MDQVARIASLVFAETPGAGTYTARIGVQPGAVVQAVTVLPTDGPWDATTAVLTMGDQQTAADAYFSGLAIEALAAYDPATPVGGTNFTDCATDGDAYKDAATPGAAPGVFYPAADLLTAVLVTTGAGGATGRLTVQVVGYGIPGAEHPAVKV